MKVKQRPCQVQLRQRGEKDVVYNVIQSLIIVTMGHGIDPHPCSRDKAPGTRTASETSLLTPSPTRLCPTVLGGRGGHHLRQQAGYQVRQLFIDTHAICTGPFGRM